MGQEPLPRTFAVGDIHGCLDRLRQLMARLSFDHDLDTIIFLGDYVNRGPDTRGVLDYLIDLRERTPRAVFLMGNHEHLLLEYARSGEVELLHTMRSVGVEATLTSYGASMRDLRDLSFLPREHLDFLEDLALSHTAAGYRFVHADVLHGPDDLRSDDQLLYSRAMARRNMDVTGQPVVFGHTPFETPLVAPDRIGIDTGAVYGNALTALELPARIFYHA